MASLAFSMGMGRTKGWGEKRLLYSWMYVIWYTSLYEEKSSALPLLKSKEKMGGWTMWREWLIRKNKG